MKNLDPGPKIAIKNLDLGSEKTEKTLNLVPRYIVKP